MCDVSDKRAAPLRYVMTPWSFLIKLVRRYFFDDRKALQYMKKIMPHTVVSLSWPSSGMLRELSLPQNLILFVDSAAWRTRARARGSQDELRSECGGMYGGQALASFTKVGSTRARVSVTEGELGCQATVKGKGGKIVRKSERRARV